MANGPPAAGRPLLPAMLSQLLVAFTVEFDNEFEHQMPHRTTRHGATTSSDRVPWLVSMPMWVHCMRFVPKGGIPAGELVRRTQLSAESAKIVVKRMSKWWGYLIVEPDRADSELKPSPSAWLVRPTRAGRQAQRVWEPLMDVIEGRWRARFGGQAIDQLRASLRGIVGRLDVELPDYLPIGQPRLQPLRTTLDEDARSQPPLPALMSKVLPAFALDFESESDLSLGIYTADGVSRLAISANILRVLDEHGVRAADIPLLTGVAKMAIDNWLGALERHRYAVVEADPAASRFKVARLTPKGRRARDFYLHWVDAIEPRWEDRFGTHAVGALRSAIERLAVEPAAQSALWCAIEPYPDGWRAQVRPPETLPHYPVVSPRGGFPDGS